MNSLLNRFLTTSLLLIACVRGAAAVDVVTADQQTLAPSDGGLAHEFGWAIAADGDTAFISAVRDDQAGQDAGAVYVFELVGSSWVELSKLTASDAVAGDDFGWSIDIEGDTAVVSAQCHINGGGGQGAAYVFTRVGSTWQEVQKLTALDGEPGDKFGRSVSISGDRIVVGASLDDDANPSDPNTQSGSSYVFSRTGGVWVQEAKLVASDASPDDAFGWAVAIEADTILVGAPGDDSQQGSAYVFRRVGAAWNEAAKITAQDGSPKDRLGRTVAIHRQWLFVAATNHVTAAGQGACYVFEDQTGTIVLREILTGSGGLFGDSLDVRDGRAAIGSPTESSFAPFAGKAEVFALVGSGWFHESTVLPSALQMLDFFGGAVALHSRGVLVGSDQADALAINSGAVYDFGLGVGQPYCSGKPNSLGCVPFVSTTGPASVSSGTPFFVDAHDTLPNEAGLLLYSFAKSNLNFHGGKLCVKAPFTRLLPAKAAKADGSAPCAGTLRRNFGNHIQNGGVPALTAGQVVYAQWRQRDPLDPAGFSDSLTNAVRFELCP